jgi:hypothetical protein
MIKQSNKCYTDGTKHVDKWHETCWQTDGTKHVDWRHEACQQTARNMSTDDKTLFDKRHHELYMCLYYQIKWNKTDIKQFPHINTNNLQNLTWFEQEGVLCFLEKHELLVHREHLTLLPFVRVSIVRSWLSLRFSLTIIYIIIM